MDHLYAGNYEFANAVGASTGRSALVAGGAILVIVMIVWAGVLADHFVPNIWVSNPALSAVAFLVSAAIFFGFIFRYGQYLQPSKQQHIATNELRVSCPTCGAAGALPAGGIGTCAFCKARVAPSPTAVQHILDSVAMERREAGFRKYRAVRTFALSQNLGLEYSVLTLWSLLLCGIFTLLFLALGVLEKPHLFAPGLYGTIVVGVLAVGISSRAWIRRRRWASKMRDLSHRMGGEYSSKPKALVEWLNTYWADSYRLLYCGLRFGTLTSTVGSYPLLLDAHPDSAFMGTHVPSRLHVLLAAHLPANTSAQTLSSNARASLRTVEQRGFEVTFVESGVLAKASQQLIRELRRQPDTLSALEDTLMSLAHVASELGHPAGAR